MGAPESGRPKRPRPSSARTIAEEVVAFDLPGIGRAVALLPVIPEDAPYRVREGIARRRIAATAGRCPCGAEVDYAAAVAEGGNVAEVAHEPLCPADTEKLLKAVRRWAR